MPSALTTYSLGECMRVKKLVEFDIILGLKVKVVYAPEETE